MTYKVLVGDGLAWVDDGVKSLTPMAKATPTRLTKLETLCDTLNEYEKRLREMEDCNGQDES